MDFVKATSTLIGGVRLDDLAREFGVTRGSVGQSRLAKSNPQYRRPPEGWEDAVEKLARVRAAELGGLVDDMAAAVSSGTKRAAAGAGRKAASKTKRRSTTRRKTAPRKAATKKKAAAKSAKKATRKRRTGTSRRSR